MSLELKHLAPYLPYKLNFVHNDCLKKLASLQYGNSVPDDNYMELVTCTNLVYAKVSEIKPILRPLSDLTKEIEVNGEKFVPIEKLLEENCFDLSKLNQEDIDSYYHSYLSDVFWCYGDAVKLISWHFDVFGLIEKGLAININTLK